MTEQPGSPVDPDSLQGQKAQVDQASQGLAKGLGGGTPESFQKDIGAIQKLINFFSGKSDSQPPSGSDPQPK